MNNLEAKVTEVVDNVEALTKKMEEMREAQSVFATFTQEQVDKIFFEAAMAANKKRISLAKTAVEETGMGIVEDKVIKNHYAAEYIYNAYKDTKTCGVIEEDPAFGIKKIAEPIGLIAAVKAGAPENIIGWIDVPSLELTNEVMKNADIILATGGPGMVKLHIHLENLR